MRTTMFTSAVLFGLAIVPAFAQAQAITTQTPPSPNSSQAGPQPDGSVPRTAETSEYKLPGSQLNGQDKVPTATSSQATGQM